MACVQVSSVLWSQKQDSQHSRPSDATEALGRRRRRGREKRGDILLRSCASSGQGPRPGDGHLLTESVFPPH